MTESESIAAFVERMRAARAARGQSRFIETESVYRLILGLVAAQDREDAS